jgi:cell division protein FtsX
MVQRWGWALGQNIHVIVYLSDEVKNPQGLADLLRQHAAVQTVRLVDPEEARSRLLASTKELGATGFETITPSLFPRSIEVALNPDTDLTAQARDLARRLRSVSGVLMVDDMTPGLEKLAVWVRIGQRMGRFVLGTLGMLAILFPVFVFLHFRRSQRPRSAVLVQLGATPFAIRWPSAILMAGAALSGGTIAAIILGIGSRPLGQRLDATLGIVAGPFPNLTFVQTLLALVGLSMFGLFAGYFATPVAVNHA